MKIVVDVFGGDNAPDEIVKGVSLALKERPEIEVALVGKKAVIEEQLKLYPCDMARVEIIEADDVITNDDNPTSAVRNKPESSLVKAFTSVRDREDCGAVVSAGNSGAVLTGALLKLGRIKGVSRPCLMTAFPTIMGDKQVLLTDCGVNMECRPEYLAQFAIMANTYCQKVCKIENPVVGLLNVGVEEDKGTEREKTAYKLLKELPINFQGNMESREYLSGKWDLIISDGFSGNVLNKGTEGAVLNFLKLFKKEVKSSFWAKIGYLFMKKKINKIKKLGDFNEYGGALFLGCKKVVVKCHGASKANSIRLSIFQAYDAIENNVCGLIKDAVDEFNAKFGEKNED